MGSQCTKSRPVAETVPGLTVDCASGPVSAMSPHEVFSRFERVLTGVATWPPGVAPETHHAEAYVASNHGPLSTSGDMGEASNVGVQPPESCHFRIFRGSVSNLRATLLRSRVSVLATSVFGTQCSLPCALENAVQLGAEAARLRAMSHRRPFYSGAPLAPPGHVAMQLTALAHASALRRLDTAMQAWDGNLDVVVIVISKRWAVCCERQDGGRDDCAARALLVTVCRPHS
jgi:hypothetical protein